MADFIDAYMAHLADLQRAEATIEIYGETLRRADRELPHGLARAHAVELHAWLYVAGRSAACLNLYRTIVCQFFAWACDPRDSVLDFDPTIYLPNRQRLPRRVPRPITLAQLADILARSREPYRTWCLLSAYGGLRCVEIAALDREHVTEQSMWIHGKGSHERIVPTHPDVWAAVSGLPEGPVARSASGGRVTRQQVISRGNHHLHRTLGLADVSMHRLRHTYGTLVHQATGDILVTRALLGHASVATTQVYAQVASESMAAAVNALPRIT